MAGLQTVKIVVDEPIRAADKAYCHIEDWRHEQLVAAFTLFVKEVLLGRKGEPAALQNDEAAQVVASCEDVVRGHFSLVVAGAHEITLRHRREAGEEHTVTAFKVRRPASDNPDDIVEALIETYRAYTPSSRHVNCMAEVFNPSVVP